MDVNKKLSSIIIFLRSNYFFFIWQFNIFAIEKLMSLNLLNLIYSSINSTNVIKR